MNKNLPYYMNALLIFILCGIISGALFIQFVENEKPCPLCLLQRVGMIGVAIGALFNLHFGIKPAHYGFSLISCLVGGAVALRQISLHVCPNFPKFGVPVFGLSLYTWSFLTFASAILYIAILLFLHSTKDETTSMKGHPIAKSAFVYLFLIILINTVATFFQCGIGPCNE